MNDYDKLIEGRPVTKVTIDLANLRSFVEEIKKKCFEKIVEEEVKVELEDSLDQLEKNVVTKYFQLGYAADHIQDVFTTVYWEPVETLEELHEQAESAAESDFYFALLNYKLQEPQRRILEQKGFDK